MLAISFSIVILLLIILSYMYFVHKERVTVDMIKKSVEPAEFDFAPATCPAADNPLGQPGREKILVDRISQYSLFNALGLSHPKIYAIQNNVLNASNLLDNFVVKSMTNFGKNNVLVYQQDTELLTGDNLSKKELAERIVTVQNPFVEELLPVEYELGFVVYWGRVILATVFSRGGIVSSVTNYGLILRNGEYIQPVTGGNKNIDLYWCEIIWPELVKEVEELAEITQVARLTVDVVFTDEKRGGNLYYLGFGDSALEVSNSVSKTLDEIYETGKRLGASCCQVSSGLRGPTPDTAR